MKKLDFLKTTKGLAIVIVISLVVGFVLGMEYKTRQTRNVLYEGLNELSNTLSDVNYDTVEEETILVEKVIGDEIEFATIKFKVNGVEEKQTISSGYSTPEIAGQNAKFVVIDVDVTNITNDPFTFWSDGIIIKDDKGRTFDSYSNTIGNIKNYLDARDLAPSITENGFMVYEIPQDAEYYSLDILKGGTNEEYAIVLK